MGDLTAEHIAQLAVLLGVLFTWLAARRTSQQAARRDELVSLRDEVNRLQERLAKAEHQLDRAVNYNITLCQYIGTLQHLMREAGLNPPPIPTQPPDHDDEPGKKSPNER